MANIQEVLVEKGAEIVVLVIAAGVTLALVGGTLIELVSVLL